MGREVKSARVVKIITTKTQRDLMEERTHIRPPWTKNVHQQLTL